jgi:hypothetical protein
MLWRSLFLIPAYLLSAALPLAAPALANLEYEYALVASYLALLLIPAVAFVLPAKHLPVEDGAFKVSAPLELLWAFVLSPLIGVASGAYLFKAGICDCSRTGFAFWMVFLWYPAWILAHAVFHAVLRARVAGRPRRVAFATTAFAYAALTIGVAVTLWVDPQKRVVNLLLGFLHGPVYDDWIAVDMGLVLARSAHLILALALMLAAWWRRSAVMIATMAAVLVAWGATSYLAGRYQSTRNGKADLEEILSAKLEGKGFTLHYRPGAKGAPLGVKRLFRDAQFEVKELSEILEETSPPHVEIYVYPEDDLKKLWFGGGNTDVTDVRTPSVHISLGSWPHPTLRHELAHALTSGFAYHGLGFHPNMAFTEGLAVALAPESRSLTLDDGAAALFKENRLPSVDALFTPLFWKVSGNRAYTAAGSFIRYLVSEHGIKGVKALYGGAEWHAAFGKSRDELVAAWKDKILAAYDAEQNGLYAEALFRKPGVLEDRCPHSKADLQRSRDEGPFVRMRQPLGWDPDANYLTWLTALDPSDTSARLRVWRREIRKIAQDRFAAPGRLATWREALARARTSPPKALEDVEMAIVESDLARLLGDVDASNKILAELADEGQRRFLGDGLTREIAVRQRLEATQAAGPQTLEWRRFLAGFRKSLPDATLAPGGPWLVSYLTGR